MLLEDKSTFKDFTTSQESIATNILSSRLKKLEEYGLIKKGKLPHNKKANIYQLTEKGLKLTPALLELTLWAYDNVSEYNSAINQDPQIELAKKDKPAFIKMTVEAYKKKSLSKQL
jgi:DNA-binding HxlR family transcriptional regulator